MQIRDVFGPLGVFLVALPSFVLAGAVVYDATMQYSMAISDDGKIVREQLLLSEPNFLWPADDRINKSWDKAAMPLFAQYKLRMSLTVAFAPLVLGFVYLICPPRIWPSFNGQKPDDLIRAMNGHAILGSLLLVACIGITLRAPGYIGFTSCRSSLFSNCLERQMLIPCLGIWASTYLFWASLEFRKLHHLENER